MRRLLIFVGAFTLAAVSAQASCFEPHAPTRSMSLRKPEPPDEPSCNRFRNCSQSEIDAYNSDARRYQEAAERYRRDAQDYVRRLQAYADAALAYAKCEVAELTD